MSWVQSPTQEIGGQSRHRNPYRPQWQRPLRSRPASFLKIPDSKWRRRAGARGASNHVSQQFDGKGDEGEPGNRKEHSASHEKTEATDVNQRMGGARIEEDG